jgi:UDP-N-acetyl-D-mannosaminuronate dehydrogenase
LSASAISATVIGAVLADRGWPVTGIDVRQTVVDEINLGKTTVPEPRLNELVANNVRVGRLRATTDFGVIADNDFVIDFRSIARVAA